MLAFSGQQKKYSGFTLIELLVVIAIIGLLSTMSVLALNSARARARDAKRLADVKQISTALEIYYNDSGNYPSVLRARDAISFGGYTYMAAVPAPPTPTDGSGCPGIQPEYTYVRTGASGAIASYTINFCLGAGISNVIGNSLTTLTPAGFLGDVQSGQGGASATEP